MGLLQGKESQPLLWQCLKTLLGSIKQSTKTPIGISGHLPRHTMAIPLGSPAPFLAPECCPKWQMGLLRGKESQPLLWQCLKTLLGSIKQSTKTPIGISGHLPRHTMTIPLGSPALFLAHECWCFHNWQMDLLRGKESQPLLWQCLKTLLGSIKQSTKTPIGISGHLPRHTMAIPLGLPALFLAPECCPKWQMGLLRGKESQPFFW